MKGWSLESLKQRKLQRLEDKEIRRWYENVARGSLITADAYLRSLFLFCERMKTDPHAMLRLKENELHGLILDFVTAEEKRGGAGHSTLNYTKSVQSWLAHNGIKLSRAIKVRRAYDTPTLREERTPTQDELKRIFLACSLKDRVSAVLMAHSGVRPEVLGNYLGNDGLRLNDIQGLHVKKGEVSFEAVPAIIVVRPELSKAGHRYFSFLSEEGCGYVKTYLEGRIEAGEVLEPDSDLIHPHSRGKRFIRAVKIGDGIRQGIRAALGRQVKMRPYVLRAYFDTQLLLAESKGKVAHDYRVFWMGHKGSMEARYTTNKGRLPPAILDDMREAYKRCEPFLSTVPSKSETQTQANIAKVLLTGLGYSEKDLAGVDFDNLDPAAFQELVQKKVAVPAAPRQKQKMVDAEELPRYLEEGWTAVMTVGGDRVVLSPPGS